MQAHGPDLSGILAATPRPMPSQIRTLGMVGVAIGIAAAAFGLYTAPERTAASFVANFLYFVGAAQGGVMFAVALMITQGRWGRPLKRIGEALGLYVPILYVLLLAFLVLGGVQIYPWTHEPMPPHKALWLQPGFFIARQAVGLGLLLVLSLLFIRASLRADLGVVREKVGTRAPAWWDRLTAGWQGDADVDSCIHRQFRLAPAVAITYAVVFSLMVTDLAMSLDPHWYANMFPAWYFMSAFASGLLMTGILSHLFRSWLGLEALLTPKVYHDLGKLNLGLCMFWAYTLFAQYLAIWYGNMDEEIGFVLVRSVLDPWSGLAKVVLLCCFLVPFALLTSRGLKKIRSAYLAVAVLISVGLWLERHLVVMPSVWKDTTLPIGPVEIGMGIGLLSGLVLLVAKVLSQVPPVPVADPWMAPNPADVHVHPSSEAHAH